MQFSFFIGKQRNFKKSIKAPLSIQKVHQNRKRKKKEERRKNENKTRKTQKQEETQAP
jgi:hypothetical protein